MVKRDEIVLKIERNLKKFELPEHRKTIRGNDSVRWLIKNISRSNSDNPKYEETMELLKSI